MGFIAKTAVSKTQEAIDVHKNARDGVGLIGAVAMLDKYTWGRNGRFEAYHNKRISELKNSQVRIKNGNLAVRTLLFGAQYSKSKK